MGPDLRALRDVASSVIAFDSYVPPADLWVPVLLQAWQEYADQQLTVAEGHIGAANLRVTADSETWLGFLAREKNLAWALLTMRIRLWGSPIWLVKFGKCFPS